MRSLVLVVRQNYSLDHFQLTHVLQRWQPLNRVHGFLRRQLLPIHWSSTMVEQESDRERTPLSLDSSDYLCTPLRKLSVNLIRFQLHCSWLNCYCCLHHHLAHWQHRHSSCSVNGGGDTEDRSYCKSRGRTAASCPVWRSSSVGLNLYLVMSPPEDHWLDSPANEEDWTSNLETLF